MFLTDLFEAQQQTKHVAFCFGRMNPPTIGHAKLMETTKQAAQGGDYWIFLSHTQDKKDNPLDYTSKVKFIKAMFPQYASHVNTDELRTIMDIAQYLYNKGYTDVTFVAGSDRLEAFQKLLTSYNGVEGKNVYYNFNKINFVSSGEREDGAEGVQGVSASQARAAALADNMGAFAQATGAGKLAEPLFQAVRNGMGLFEHIVKVKGGYELKSKKTGKNLGKYPSKAGAEKRERQVNYFKNMDEAHPNQQASLYNPDGTTYRQEKMPGYDPDDIYSRKQSVEIGPEHEYMMDINDEPEPMGHNAGLERLLKANLDKLDPREKQIMYARFYKDQTLEQLAKQYGVGTERIRQIEAHALRNLRQQMKNVDLGEAAGTGVVKGGNDPRYKNALTVDVKPNTLGKEMQAFGLVGRKNPGAPSRQTPVGKNIGKGKKPS